MLDQVCFRWASSTWRFSFPEAEKTSGPRVATTTVLYCEVHLNNYRTSSLNPGFLDPEFR